jgi:Mrp family chromosome partitioning ATPase/capsular polysaccharide biosynthesis protein
MNRSTNPQTLRELLRPISAHWLVLTGFVVLAVGASVVYSATKKPVYTAQASVAYQDQSYQLGLVGLAVASNQTADQLASRGAETIIKRSVGEAVKRQLRSSQSADSLTNAVTARVQPSSSLIVIEAKAPTAAQAQQLATAFATQGAATTNSDVRALYKAAYRSALQQLRRRGAPRLDATAQALESGQLSRLQVLGSIATTAQVVKLPRLPSAPSSPRPFRDGALAAVLGAVLGLLAVYVRDAFDRRLRSVGDVEEQFSLPMLGHVRTEALGRSPRLNGDRGAQAIDWELFRILRRNLDFLGSDQPFHSIAVTSSLPQEGKSTVAAFLAFTSAAAGKRTLLLECDLRRPVFAERLGINIAPGITDHVLDHAGPAEILQVIRFGDPISINGAVPPSGHAPNRTEAEVEDEPKQYMHELTCITAGTRTQHPIEVLRSEAFMTMLRRVRDAYDVVVLDTPPLLSVVDTLEVLPQVDAAVVCVRVFSTTRHQAGAGRAALKRLPQRPTGLVVTGTRRSAEAEYGYYGYYDDG